MDTNETKDESNAYRPRPRGRKRSNAGVDWISHRGSHTAVPDELTIDEWRSIMPLVPARSRPTA